MIESKMVENQSDVKISTNLIGSNKTISNRESQASWLLRFFESKHFDMSIAISYLFNSKEIGVKSYLCNRLFTFPNYDVDFYLPQLLNIYVYTCNEINDQITDMLSSYFKVRCNCEKTGIDFSLKCSWLLDAHINDNAVIAINSKENHVKRSLNKAIKLYKLVTTEKLKQFCNDLVLNRCDYNIEKNQKIINNNNRSVYLINSFVKEEPEIDGSKPKFDQNSNNKYKFSLQMLII